MRVLSWAEADRPREKLMAKGKSVLTDAELLAIIMGSGTREVSAVDLAKSILSSVNNNLHELAKLSLKDLMKFKGIGEAKAIAIISTLELGRRRKESDVLKKEKIGSSADVFNCMKPHLLDLPHEEFWILLLSRANEVMKKVQCSSGGVSGTVADPKIIFKEAIAHLSSAIILVHNHPSGNLKPSQADITLTKKIKEGGNFMDLPVLDHVIFTNDGYFSFADEGMI